MPRLIIPLIALAIAFPLPGAAETPSQIADRIKRDNPHSVNSARLEGGRLIVSSRAQPHQAERLAKGACADTSPRDVRRVQVLDTQGRNTVTVDCTRPTVRQWGN